MPEKVRNVIIIGSGCSGLTAALYAARANLSPLVIDGHEPGGQLSITTLVENFPGFPEGIQGPELIDNMRKQAARFGAEFMAGHVVKVDLSQKSGMRLGGEATDTLAANEAADRLGVTPRSVYRLIQKHQVRATRDEKGHSRVNRRDVEERRHGGGEKIAAEIASERADQNKKPIEVSLGRETLLTRTLIIASGASARWLGLPNEQALIGHGVSSCATCDGFFFSGKEIAVIGGGDSAMEEALFLTRFASKVTLIHRRGEFRASKIMLDRARKHEQIQFLTDTVVDDVYDVNKKEVTGLRLRNVKTGEQWDFPTSAMFLGIGHTPNAQFVGDQLKRDGEGYLIPEGFVCSRAPGVFISGDVADRHYRQAVTAAGTGCMAALEVEKYLEEIGK